VCFYYFATKSFPLKNKTKNLQLLPISATKKRLPANLHVCQQQSMLLSAGIDTHLGYIKLLNSNTKLIKIIK
jgi:hypothetical protein